MCGKGKFNDYVITKSSKFGHPHPHLPPPCSGLFNLCDPLSPSNVQNLISTPNQPPSPSLRTKTVNFVIL